VLPITRSAQPSCHAPLLYALPYDAVNDHRIKPSVGTVLVRFAMLPNGAHVLEGSR
jgi:hypothetical protein